MKPLLPPLILNGRGVRRTINSQVMQSPLAGVSDQIFRGLIRKWAPEVLLFTEMVNATSLGLGHGSSKVKELTHETGPVGVQLFDHRPQAMIHAAKQAEAAGAFLIDINMGCPVRKIARKGGGSGLIKDPQLAAEIVQKVVSAVQIPVTVKTRLGWSPESADPIGFALRLQDAGAQLLTLHGRTREQGFSGKADWDAIAKVKRALEIPLIANGDIYNVDDALLCLKTTGADGIMIGRGSLGSPWVVGQINCALKGEKVFKVPEPKERISLVLEQLQKLVDSKGDHGLLIARKHMSWTCRGFPGASKLRHDLVRASTPQSAKKLLEIQISAL